MNSRIDTIFTRADGDGPTRLLGHPDNVIRDPGMTVDEKRAMLAAWASDAHAVENAPPLRQLDDGSVVPVDDILRALKSLELTADPAHDARRATPPRRRTFLSRFRPIRIRRDDDDEPPPCPASAMIPVQWRRTEARAAA